MDERELFRGEICCVKSLVDGLLVLQALTPSYVSTVPAVELRNDLLRSVFGLMAEVCRATAEHIRHVVCIFNVSE